MLYGLHVESVNLQNFITRMRYGRIAKHWQLLKAECEGTFVEKHLTLKLGTFKVKVTDKGHNG